MPLIALMLNLCGAVLVYLTAARQQFLSRPLPRAFRGLALPAMVAGAVWTIDEMGFGAGLSATLTCWMLTWVLLPYLAWWRQPSARPIAR